MIKFTDHNFCMIKYFQTYTDVSIRSQHKKLRYKHKSHEISPYYHYIDTLIKFQQDIHHTVKKKKRLVLKKSQKPKFMNFSVSEDIQIKAQKD